MAKLQSLEIRDEHQITISKSSPSRHGLIRHLYKYIVETPDPHCARSSKLSRKILLKGGPQPHGVSLDMSPTTSKRYSCARADEATVGWCVLFPDYHTNRVRDMPRFTDRSQSRRASDEGTVLACLYQHRHEELPVLKSRSSRRRRYSGRPGRLR